MKQTADLTISFTLPIKIKKKGKWYISSCPALDVFSQGENPEQARANIKEALTAFFIGCMELGTLDAVLKECGFKPEIKPDNHFISKDEYVNIPVHLFTSSERLVCRA